MVRPITFARSYFCDHWWQILRGRKGQVNEGQGVGGLGLPRLGMSPRVTLTLMTSGNWRVTISIEGRLPTHEHQYSSRTRNQAARPSPSRGPVRRRLPGAT